MANEISFAGGRAVRRAGEEGGVVAGGCMGVSDRVRATAPNELARSLIIISVGEFMPSRKIGGMGRTMPAPALRRSAGNCYELGRKIAAVIA